MQNNTGRKPHGECSDNVQTNRKSHGVFHGGRKLYGVVGTVLYGGRFRSHHYKKQKTQSDVLHCFDANYR